MLAFPIVFGFAAVACFRSALTDWRSPPRGEPTTYGRPGVVVLHPPAAEERGGQRDEGGRGGHRAEDRPLQSVPVVPHRRLREHDHDAYDRDNREVRVRGEPSLKRARRISTKP